MIGGGIEMMFFVVVMMYACECDGAFAEINAWNDFNYKKLMA